MECPNHCAGRAGSRISAPRRTGVEDRWKRSDGRKSSRYGKGMRWLARYVDDGGREHSKAFIRKGDAQKWLDQQTTAIGTGTHVAPRDAQITVTEWCAIWMEGYGVNRPSTVRQARIHIRQITAEFGDMPLSAVRPSQVKTWVAKLKDDGAQASYVYALHSRLAQIFPDPYPTGCSRAVVFRAIRSARS